jgi:hypothetical protein
LKGEGANLIGSGGRPGPKDWRGHGRAEDLVGSPIESAPALGRHLRRRGLLGIDEDGADPEVPGDPETNLAASAISGQTRRAAVGELLRSRKRSTVVSSGNDRITGRFPFDVT